MQCIRRITADEATATLARFAATARHCLEAGRKIPLALVLRARELMRDGARMPADAPPEFAHQIQKVMLAAGDDRVAGGPTNDDDHDQRPKPITTTRRRRRRSAAI